MPRQRYQTGKIFTEGRKPKKWYGRYHVYVTDESGQEKRKWKFAVLGPIKRPGVQGLNKTEAAAKLREIIARETGKPGARPDPDTAWETFIRERYLPLREDAWKARTKQSSRNFYEQHIIPAFGNQALGEIGRFECQAWLNRQKGKSKSHVLHCNSHLKAVLQEAVRQRFIDSNPAEDLTIPRYKEPGKRHLSIEEIRKLTAALLNPRDRLIFRFHLVCALRPGETFALRWDDWEGRTLRIDEDLEGSSTRVQDSPKTETSAAKVALTAQLEQELEAWKLIARPASERWFIFGDERPRSYNAYLKKVLQPIAEGVGIYGLTFQAMRRTASTHQSKHGSPKDVQAQMRHADAATTFGVYVQEIPETVKAMLEAFEQEIAPDEKIQ
jgi:integrase